MKLRPDRYRCDVVLEQFVGISQNHGNQPSNLTTKPHHQTLALFLQQLKHSLEVRRRFQDRQLSVVL